MMILAASVCGSALCAMYYLKEQYDYNIRRLPPGPSSFPIIGNALSISMKNPHLSMIELAKRYGDIFSFKLGSKRVVVLNSADVIKEAYSGIEICNRPQIYSLEFLVNGKGFMTCTDHRQWKLHMMLCKNAMRVINNTSLGNKITMETTSLVKQFASRNSKPFNPKEDLHLASLNILCNLVFGERYERGDPELTEILDYSAEIMKVISPIHPVNTLPWLRHFPNKWFDALFKAKDKRDKILMKKYIQHFATFDEENIRDMLDALLSATKEATRNKDNESLSLLTPEHVIINMWLIFFAGTDTTANTLLWALLYMAAFPKKQALIHDELDRVVGPNGQLNLEHRPDMPYLEATVYEILRYSSLTILGVPHAAARDTNVRGFHIPKGTQVLANIWAVHHDEEAWDRPHEFLPERFLNSEGKMKKPSEFPHFMPFSTGRRICIGKNIAKCELFLLIGNLLQEYTFRMPDNVEPDLEGEVTFSLVPKPYEIVAEPRIKPEP
ncbi:steroid 17-alpha-hydroxylase/17,20 lyase-like isoform X1 [Antedon mediterranea]|uniref:steroid 17-alpha-hydroxylase/17,20 lyase-like isoform X1 n=1 Tax=Antedon mediterranea TaxID=105859 RepID=UPI003AF737EB